MERLVDRHISDGTLALRPLHTNQHTYQAGKSVETALHQLVVRVEKVLDQRELPLGVFLDIEGAFNYTSYDSMCNALDKRGVSSTTIRWIKATLEGRVATATLNDMFMRVAVSRGCPQGGVLSPLLWCLVVDDLIARLSGDGVYCQGYADDICLLVMGKFPNTVSELMQGALHTVEKWCGRVGLSVNPDKTDMVVFTMRRKLDGFFEPLFFGVTLHRSRAVKYLGVILDSRLSWREHVKTKVMKAHNLLWACRRAFGKTWGLQPKVVYWLYVSIIRSSITFASLVWWPGCQTASAKKQLSRIQRSACLGITGAMRITSTSALEVLTCLPPLDLVVQSEARLAAHRIWSLGCWSYLHFNGRHSSILIRLQKSDPIFSMGNDIMRPIYNFEIRYKVNMLNREEWTKGPGSPPVVKGLVWYTDGSRTQEGRSGAGVYGQFSGRRLSISLGKHVTVFQADIYAILACVYEIQAYVGSEKYISICSDSQAALKAI
jgi:hypothetical protein